MAFLQHEVIWCGACAQWRNDNTPRSPLRETTIFCLDFTAGDAPAHAYTNVTDLLRDYLRRCTLWPDLSLSHWCRTRHNCNGVNVYDVCIWEQFEPSKD